MSALASVQICDRQERPAVAEEDRGSSPASRPRPRDDWSRRRGPAARRSGRSRPSRSPRTAATRRLSSGRMVFWATMWTTDGETALATSLERPVHLPELLVLLRQRIIKRLVVATFCAGCAARSRPTGSSASASPRSAPATWADTTGPPRARTIPSTIPALNDVNDRMTAEDRDSINGTPCAGAKTALGCDRSESARPGTSRVHSTFDLDRSNILPAVAAKSKRRADGNGSAGALSRNSPTIVASGEKKSAGSTPAVLIGSVRATGALSGRSR